MKKFFERTSGERKLLGKADIFVLLILAVLCVSLCAPFFLKKGEVTATIIYDGEAVEVINLSKNEESFSNEDDEEIVRNNNKKQKKSFML